MQMIPAATRWARRLRGALIASDPGLARLRMAVNGAGAMATALGVEYAVAGLRGLDTMATMIAMLLGAVVAMMGGMALTGVSAWPKIRTAVFFPVAIGLGLALGVLTRGHTTAMLAVFVAVMFVAVFVRRFGLPFFFYGFMLWMGYFFAAFLQTTWSMLPALVLDTAIATAWVLLLSVTVLRTHPGRTLLRVRRSFDARARRTVHTAAELLDPEVARSAPLDVRPRRRLHPQRARRTVHTAAELLDPGVSRSPRAERRLRRRLHRRLASIAEASLMIEAWSAEPEALPPEWSGQALRRRILDVQLALDGLVLGSEQLTEAPAQIRRTAARLALEIARGRHASAGHHADELERLAQRSTVPRDRADARQVVVAARRYLELVESVGTPPEATTGEFTPSVSLAMGNLPGSVAVASNVQLRGWNPLNRLSFTSRQAVQVAVAGGLAILLGRELNETRYYWAVIAAFIAFTGTGSRAETLLKAGYRVLGTLVGLVAGIELAHATAGHPGWSLVVIVGSMFCGFYLMRVNYAYMIFFVTIMVAQLYSVLHEFSDGLLVLRLEETVIGAAAGILVALVVTPLSTRATVRLAQQDLFGALARLLDLLAGVPVEEDTDDEDPVVHDRDSRMRELDDRLRQLALVAAPLVRPLLVGSSPALVRHRLALHAQAVQASRILRVTTVAASAELRQRCHAIAELARAMAEDPIPLGGTPVDPGPAGVVEARAAAERALFGGSTEQPNGPSGAALVRLFAVLSELARPATASPTAEAAQTDGSGTPRRLELPSD